MKLRRCYEPVRPCARAGRVSEPPLEGRQFVLGHTGPGAAQPLDERNGFRSSFSRVNEQSRNRAIIP